MDEKRRRLVRLVRYRAVHNRIARRYRLAAFRLVQRMTGNRAIDVTGLWRESHSHLVPMKEQIGRLEGELVVCPQCREERALRILAHVRLGSEGWADRRDLLFCYSCEHFSLPVSQLMLPRARQLLRGRTLREGSASLRPSRLNGKLWSDSSLVLNLEPTTKCNFRCWYCVGRHMKQEHLSYENFVSIIDNSPDLKVLLLVGEGEPLLHRQFFEMVAYAKKRGMLVSITTNGSMFTEEIVEKLCDAQVELVSISIDSADPERFAESRVGGDLSQVWAGIERLSSHRNARGLRFPIISVRGTPMAPDPDDIAEILREARARGVDGMDGFQTLNAMEAYAEIYPENKQHHLDDTKEIGRAIQKAMMKAELPVLTEQLEDVLPAKVVQGEGFTNRLRQNCDRSLVYSLLSGDVTPCCQIKSVINPEWNLARNSMDAVLKHPDHENTRFNLWNGIFTSQCRDCWGTVTVPTRRPAVGDAS
jgi:MoaA/NifB/PqqE/SkfB family radical SAM enzyme